MTSLEEMKRERGRRYQVVQEVLQVFGGSSDDSMVFIGVAELLNNPGGIDFFLTTMMNMNQYLLQNHLSQTKRTLWYRRFQYTKQDLQHRPHSMPCFIKMITGLILGFQNFQFLRFCPLLSKILIPLAKLKLLHSQHIVEMQAEDCDTNLKQITKRSNMTVLYFALIVFPINYDFTVCFMYFRADRNIDLAFLSGVHLDKIISSYTPGT